MSLIAFFDHDFRLLPEDQAPCLLSALGVERGALAAPQRPVSSAPQLTHARELQALQSRFHTVLTDRLRIVSASPAGRQRHTPVRHPVGAEPAGLHTHCDREIRVVVAGQACFTLQAPFGWATVVCDARDWIALPAGLPHRCQAHPEHGADLLRMFSLPYGWAPDPMGLEPPGGLAPWPLPAQQAAARSTSA